MPNVGLDSPHPPLLRDLVYLDSFPRENERGTGAHQFAPIYLDDPDLA